MTDSEGKSSESAEPKFPTKQRLIGTTTISPGTALAEAISSTTEILLKAKDDETMVVNVWGWPPGPPKKEEPT